MPTITQIQFARTIYAAAKKATDIAPEFVTAQAILESGWGRSRVGQHNLFGITRGTGWKGKTVLVLTHEYFNTPNRQFTPPERIVSVVKTATPGRYHYTVYRLFKDFNSLEECLAEHTRLLQKPGYADAWPYRKDAEQFARRICNTRGCRYATSPIYLKQILSPSFKQSEKYALKSTHCTRHHHHPTHGSPRRLHPHLPQTLGRP